MSQCVLVGRRHRCRRRAHRGQPFGADVGVDVRRDLLGDNLDGFLTSRSPTRHGGRRGQPRRPLTGAPVVDRHCRTGLFVDQPTQAVPQHLAGTDRDMQRAGQGSPSGTVPVDEFACHRR